MSHRAPSAACLVADLLRAVDRGDPFATLLAIEAVARRLGQPAASTLAQMMRAGRHRADVVELEARSLRVRGPVTSARCA